MASEREAAKGAVLQKENADPELDSALAKAALHQLELKREENRHKEAMNRQNLGVVGNLFGDGKNIPTTAALLTVVLAFIVAAGLYVAAFAKPEAGTLWAAHAERALSVALAALAYILGKSTR